MKENKFFLQMHITDECHVKCRHCYQSNHNRAQMNLGKAKDIIDDFVETCEILNAESTMCITGGDPFYNYNFFEIAKYARSKVDWLGVMCNPTFIVLKEKEGFAERLKALNLNRIQLSLDGLKVTHDDIRVKGSWEMTWKAIDLLQKQDIEIAIMSTVSSFNYLEMNDLARLLYESGIKYWAFSREAKEGGCGISSKSYMKFIRDIHEVQSTFDNRTHAKESLTVLIDDSKIDLAERQVSGGCGLGLSTISVLPDGMLMGCRRVPTSELGYWNKTQNILWHFVNNEKMKSYRDFSKIEKCSNCKYVFYCRGCRAQAQGSSGNEFSADPQCPMGI